MEPLDRQTTTHRAKVPTGRQSVAEKHFACSDFLAYQTLITSTIALKQVFEQNGGNSHAQIGVTTRTMTPDNLPHATRIAIYELTDDDECLPATVIVWIHDELTGERQVAVTKTGHLDLMAHSDKRLKSTFRRLGPRQTRKRGQGTSWIARSLHDVEHSTEPL